MDKKDLMCGDWVYNRHNQSVEQVNEIREDSVMLAYNDLYEYDEIEPVLLTKEIIDNNNMSALRKVNIIFHGGVHGTSVKYTEADGYITILNMRIFYVHEFQHVLKLMGIEKEIEIINNS